MAIVYKYTIIYFTLIVHESMTITIRRDLCLGTVARFIDHEDRCGFGLSTAVDILQDDTTCPKKCSFRIYGLNCEDEYSLYRINLTIGNTNTVFDSCLSFPRRTLYISCSSWNAGEYIHEIRYEANSCYINNAQCFRINNNCICHCMPGYILVDDKCLKRNLQLNDPCELTEQCIQPLSFCLRGKCKCINGYSAFYKDNCIKANLELNDSCELTEQCKQPFSVCFQGKCICIKGYSAFDTDTCIKDTVPVGGFCNLSRQCTGSNSSGVCENGRCTCAKEFTSIDLACKNTSDLPNSLGIESSISQQHDINIGVTLGTLFGGFILGVIVTAVVTTLIYRRLIFRTRTREEPDVMFADNRTCGGANSAQILYKNDKKQNVAKLSPYPFAKETQGHNLSSKQEDERTDDVYNHLHEQTEQYDDTYDHACAVPIQSTDLSDYSNIHDAATFRTTLSKNGDDYSTLRK